MLWWFWLNDDIYIYTDDDNDNNVYDNDDDEKVIKVFVKITLINFTYISSFFPYIPIYKIMYISILNVVYAVLLVYTIFSFAFLHLFKKKMK